METFWLSVMMAALGVYLGHYRANIPKYLKESRWM